MRACIRPVPFSARPTRYSAVAGSSSPASTSSARIDSDIRTVVSGLRRSWLTWPAKAVSWLLERCSSSRTRSSSETEEASSRVRSSSSSRSTTRSASSTSARSWSAVISRGTVSKTHRVPITTPCGVMSWWVA